MDVRCERCSTEYEFDDALVSGRGTTVKCTNCGHKFKIRRSDGDFSEDFWNVQTGDGRTLVFTSLRELQRAIQTNLVDRSDLLSRGGLKQKPIGQIPELAPFFDQRDPRPAAPDATSEKRASRPPPPPGVTTPALAAPPRQRMSTRPDFPPAPPEKSDRPPGHVGGSIHKTLMGTGSEETTTRFVAASPPAAAEPVPAAPAMRERLEGRRPSEAPPSTEREPEPDTQRFAREEPAPEPADARPAPAPVLTTTQPLAPPGPVLFDLPKHTPPPPAFEASSPLPAPTVPVLRTLVDDDYQDGARGRSPSDIPPSSMRRRSVGGYIVAVVVVAGVALIGVLWARNHLGGILGGKAPAPVATTDPRVSTLLATGEKALADGNLDIAKESFDKASALAEKDPRVLLDVARLAAVRADLPWLKSRLLAADATDENRSTKDSLAELSSVARRAADDALAVAPDDPAALRAKVDSLRISGDRDGARALVGKVSSSSSQPETAYVLAGLDLADPEPLWSQVLERLRVAANAESGPGRARAALAYALARSGDVSGAKAEVERLASMSRQHPLLPQLRSFADHAKPVVRVDALPDAGPLAVLPDGGRVRDRGEKPERGEKGGRLPNDARVLIQQGEAARAKGEYDRAQLLFAAALDRNPNDTEALNGLAAIAHSRRDLNGARASYKRVLSINPSYVPALVGLGDVEFESGDRASAMKTYKDIVDRFPEGTYPARVKQRLDPAPAPAPTPSDPGGGG
jgi:predicted Zn finger-like uncharacterized protein